jgi:hypothetical protein
MFVTCPECDQRVKVNGTAAKVRCPECGKALPIPSGKSAIARKPTGPAKKSRDPDEDADDADEAVETPKKSSFGLIVGLLGCGALLLLGVVAIAGAGGVWFVFLREKPADGQGAQANNNNPPAPAKELRVSLAEPRVDRFGDQIQLTVQYEAFDAKADSTAGIFMEFPSDADNPAMVKLLGAKELQNGAKGVVASARIDPGFKVKNDLTCDLVARSPDGAGDFKKGKELARIGGVAIPPHPDNRPLVLLSKVTARTNNANSQVIDFTFDCNVSGPRPASNLICFDAEFVAPGSGLVQRVPLTQRTGADIRASETITASVPCPLANCDLCHLAVSDRDGGNGNLTRVQNVRIDRPAPPPPPPDAFSVTILNPKIDYALPGQALVSVGLKGSGKPGDGLYQPAVVFRVKGVKQQPANFGNALSGKELLDSIRIEGAPVQMPPDADPFCDIIVREQFKDAPVGQLANFLLPGRPKITTVMLSNLRVFKVDDFTVQLQFDYEFTKDPDPQKWYTILVQRGDLKDAASLKTGISVWQFRGDNLPKSGQVNKRVSGNGFGGANSYRVWAASGKNQLDVNTRESKTYIVKVGGGVAEGKDVTLANVRVEKLADDRIRVSADYDFAKVPDPKKTYILYVDRAEGFDPGALFHPELRKDSGDKWQKTGQIKADVQCQGKGDGFRVWMIETPGFQTCSNNVVVNAGAQPGGNEMIQIASAKLNSFGKKGSVVEVTHKVAAGTKLNAQSVYKFVLLPKGGNPFAFFQVPGAKMPAEGAFPFPTGYILGNDTEIEVYIVDASAQNRIVSNKKLAEVKK